MCECRKAKKKTTTRKTRPKSPYVKKIKQGKRVRKINSSGKRRNKSTRRKK